MKRLIRAILIIAALGALLVGCSFGLLVKELTTPAGESDVAVEFTIQPKTSVTEVAANLEDAGLVRRALMFRLLTRLRHTETIYDGTYFISPNMTMDQILGLITTAPIPQEAIKITVIEGLRLEEIAEAIADQTGTISVDEFLSLARNVEAFRADYAFLADVPAGGSLEGFLFPNTYDVYADATAEDIIRKLLDQFDIEYASVTQNSGTAGRSVYEIVTMASIIEREAANSDEMPRISAVFWNRLKPEFAGNQLGSDPTVQYIVGQSGNWWPKELTDADLNTDNPYNTRIYANLPPGPISAPGFAALQAAAAPADEAITYFVAKCVPEGEKPTHNFASTYDEFLVYQDEYLQCP